MFWNEWKKVRKKIAKAVAKQRARDEKFYTREMEKQRQRLADANQQTEENLQKKFNEKIKKIEKKWEEKNLELKLRVVDMDQKVRDAQEAWRIYKDWVPEALNSAITIRTGLFLKQQELSRSLGIVHGGEDKLDDLQKKVIEKTEKIEKLLHFEVGE